MAVRFYLVDHHDGAPMQYFCSDCLPEHARRALEAEGSTITEQKRSCRCSIPDWSADGCSNHGGAPAPFSQGEAVCR